MEMEKAVKSLYLYNYDLVDGMFKSIVEDLISMTEFHKRSSENVSAEQVQEWVKKLLKLGEYENEYVRSVSSEYIKMMITIELQKEIEQRLSKK